MAMSVYVDDMAAPFRGMKMCHMWADTREELFAMADRIGVARRWLQTPPRASWEHFDISLSKRKLAVRHGAIETDRYGPALRVAQLSGNQRRVDHIEMLRTAAAPIAQARGGAS